ncbi:hypothetical protein PS3A_61100 [Pseudomonas sp. 3A(2025)]
MSEERRPFNAEQPESIDTTEDRMGSVHELDFDDDETARIGDEIPEQELEQEIPDRRVREAGMTGASTPDHHGTDDDLQPDTLIREDGARSPSERGADRPADKELSAVDQSDIGAGHGLDEEELAHLDPLDGKPE